jgi:hypothetical protein
MNADVFKDLVRDFGFELRQYALDAKLAKQQNPTSDFHAGYLNGFHRVVSLLQQQAESFGVNIEDVFLQDLDPDRDLV